MGRGRIKIAMEQIIFGERIVVNPGIMVGKPIIKGTRVTVEQILKLLAQGFTVGDILKEYPHVQREDIQEAIAYAATAVGAEEVHPLRTR